VIGDDGDSGDGGDSGDDGDNASEHGDDEEPEFQCDNCGEAFDRDRGIRSAPMGDLDTSQWQRFDCPNCGTRVKTVFVGNE
jgi:predicted RNA-binding Zn-ribbon protein involved in translation (DUF1610 family)